MASFKAEWVFETTGAHVSVWVYFWNTGTLDISEIQ